MRWVVRQTLSWTPFVLGVLIIPSPAWARSGARGAVHLQRPALAGWAGLAPSWKLRGLTRRPVRTLPEGFTHWAIAREPELQTFGYVGKKAWLWGKVRQGQRIAVKHEKDGDHCSGAWYATPSGAYLCDAHGYTITPRIRRLARIRPPAQQRTLPYTYLKARHKPTLQFDDLPSIEDARAARAALKEGDALPDGAEALEGAFFVALDRKVKGASGLYYRTIAGHYVQARDMERVRASPMRGELLGGRHGARLPLAFVHKERAAVRCGRAARRCGVADKHARFHVARELKRGGRRYVEGPRGVLVARDDVRLARRIERPDDIDAKEKWVHFDLAQQVLVAYEGDRPVFTTLFSSGKPGHATPAGSHRVYLKYISARMSGDDPKDGPYDIGEVPWVMYYDESYAVHGAYWHDLFGQVRSHGCTNLAPADARWIFFWSEPEIPAGWHGKYVHEGTIFYFSS